MNFTSVLIKTLVVLAVLFLLSLAKALSFPLLSSVLNGTGTGLTSLVLFLFALLLLSVVGTLLAKGIREIKKIGEAVLMGFVGALAMGGIIAIFAQLNVPYSVTVNLAWAGAEWYSPLLTLLFIGIPLMFVFLLGE